MGRKKKCVECKEAGRYPVEIKFRCQQSATLFCPECLLEPGPSLVYFNVGCSHFSISVGSTCSCSPMWTCVCKLLKLLEVNPEPARNFLPSRPRQRQTFEFHFL